MRLSRLFLIACLSLCVSASYKPVIIMHGILDSYATMHPLVAQITDAHAGTTVISLNVFNWLYSMEGMWKQVAGVISAIQALPAEFNDGYHCIGFSQGTLILRAVVETWSDHKCINMITLSGPLMGQFGDTNYLRYFFPQWTRNSLYEIFYYNNMIDRVSVAAYWKDPFHIPLYLEVNNFLATLNNENGTINSTYKANFLKLKNWVMVGGPDDGVITPWQSAQFGFFDKNLTVVLMEKQWVYTNDSFGLQTMDRRRGLHKCTLPGVEHTTWYSNVTVFGKCIEPWLS